MDVQELKRDESVPPPAYASVVVEAAAAAPQDEAKTQADPKVLISLRPKKLVILVLSYCVVVGGFTWAALRGISAGTVYEEVGSSSKAEAIVERYNTISGFIMAFVEVMLGLHGDLFVSVFSVYVHNALWFLIDGPPRKRRVAMRALHQVIMVAFPVIIMLGVGNSIRGFQAGQSTVGFESRMVSSDLEKDKSMVQLIEAAAAERGITPTYDEPIMVGDYKLRDVDEIILKNAVRMQTTPFAFDTDSPCFKDKNDATETPVRLNVHDLDSTTIVYGFTPQDWNSEAIPRELIYNHSYEINYTQVLSGSYEDLPAAFNLSTLFDMLVQGTVMFERVVGDASSEGYHCSLSDGRYDLDTASSSSSSSATASSSGSGSSQARHKMRRRRRRMQDGTSGSSGSGATASSGATGSDTTDTTSTSSTGTSSSSGATTSPSTSTPSTTSPSTSSTSNSTAATNSPSTNTTDSSTSGQTNSGSGSVTNSSSSSSLSFSGASSNSSAFDSFSDDGSDGFMDDDEWYYYDGDDDSLNQWTKDENGTRICQGAVTSLLDISAYVEEQTVGNLVSAIVESLNKSLGNLQLEKTRLMVETYDISPQIHVDAMRIEASMMSDLFASMNPVNVDLNDTVAYVYESLTQVFCGSANCIFLDPSESFQLQKEIVMIPYTNNCALDSEHVKYSGDFRGYYPTNCTKQIDSVFIFGVGSFIAGDEYGSDDSVYDTGMPYIWNPERRVRISYAKLTWTFENVADQFNATCEHLDCMGLYYQLQPSGRYLFAGQEALPLTRIQNADFHAPIPLVELNTPTLYVDSLKQTVELERLNPDYFDIVKWNPVNFTSTTVLSGSNCSMLMDSYMNQIETNNYFLERPLQAMYTSAFYYLFANGAVTELLDTASVVNASLNASYDFNTNSLTSVKNSSQDALGNTKLKGDQQIRAIRVQIPRSSFLASFMGCVLLFMIMAIALLFPIRRVEYFAEATTTAQEFVAIMTNEDYPKQVYRKTLRFPDTGEHVPMSRLRVDRITLINEKTRDHTLEL